MRSLLRSFFHCAVPLALLAVLASCEDEGGASPIEASDFCDAYVEAFCEGFDSCCGDQFVVGGPRDCQSQARYYCEERLLTLDDRGIAPSGPNVPARIVFDFDEASAGAAIARVRSAFGRCEGRADVTFADTHFLGEPGSECLQHQDCFEGMRCEHPPRAVFGTCVVAPLEGQACTDVCAASDLFCSQDRGDLICVGPRKEGEPCERAPCDIGLVCTDGWGSTIGGSSLRCQEQGEEGDSCSYDEECKGYLCEFGRCAADSSRAQFCTSLTLGLLIR